MAAALEWLDENSSADVEEFKTQQKALEKIVNPIMAKVYGSSGGAPGGMPDMGGDDDLHEEL